LTVLRLWLLATAAFLLLIAVWGFAPILFALALVVGALAVATGVMVAGARSLQSWRDRRRPPPP
jgi:hypothetical protein